jgi:N-methylhydantoinase A
MKRLGIDTGGTFTDFVYSDGERLLVHKVLSTPDAPDQAILQGVREMGISLDDDLLIIHGSTVATNAVLEGKGVRTAYITNRGFADVLTIGRQARRELYNLCPEPGRPPVPVDYCLETGGRIAADGEILDPLTEEDLDRLREQIAALQVEAVAINLLFSFVDDAAERRIAASMPADVFVSRSSRVMNEFREYERGMATWLNAYVGPLMQRYLSRLATELQPATVRVMQSHGGTIDADSAGAHAVQLLLSGPAGGLVGARFQGAASGHRQLMTFDMGGTSTDVALIDGALRLSGDAEIAGYPVAVPMVDLHTIGAGGGSIAWLDSGGMLQVGPQSSGADPGPACYGRGGRKPTVTDANLVLGRLPSRIALGGSLKLNLGAARTALEQLGKAAGLSLEAVARGILRIADEHMAQALRVISLQKGHDPRDFALMCFGGAGGLHVCQLAELLGMSKAIIPQHGGVLSALGMLVAPQAQQLSHSRVVLLDSVALSDVEQDFQHMEQRLTAEMGGSDKLCFTRMVDLRFRGQSSTLQVDWKPEKARMVEQFHRLHREQYGFDLEIAVELVNLRVRAEVEEPEFVLPAGAGGQPAVPIGQSDVAGLQEPVDIYRREDLAVGQSIVGPAIIVEPVSTSWIAPGWVATNDVRGNLGLNCGG